MTTREMLTLAAKAMGYESSTDETGRTFIVNPNPSRNARMYPLTHSGDCAELCAALGISTNWPLTLGDATRAIRFVACATREHRWEERIKDHNNDRSAAWRMAAVRVASEIGRGRNVQS